MPLISFLFWMMFIARESLGLLIFQNPGAAFRFAVLVPPVALTIALVFRFSSKRKFTLPLGGAAALVLIYVGWSGLSVTWTQAKDPARAAALWVSLVCSCLAVIVMADRRGRTQLAALYGFICGAILNGIYVVVDLGGASGMRPGESATFIHPNVLGNRIAMGALIALSIWATRRGRTLRHLVILLFLASTLFLTSSKTSVIAFAVACIGFVLVTKAICLRTKLVLVLALAVVGALLLPLVEPYYEKYDASTALTMTGRVPLWFATAGLTSEHLGLGYGFDSFYDNSPHLLHTIHAHNEWLQQLFTGGIISLLLALAIYSAFIRSTAWTPGVLLFVYFLVRSIAEADEAGLGFPAAVILLFCFAPATEGLVSSLARARYRSHWPIAKLLHRHADEVGVGSRVESDCELAKIQDADPTPCGRDIVVARLQSLSEQSSSGLD